MLTQPASPGESEVQIDTADIEPLVPSDMTPTEEAFPCKDAGPHKCTCGDTVFNLLVHGDSVQFFDKTFSAREIVQLKAYNGDSKVSTFEIFTKIDKKTRMCKYQFGTFST